MKLDRGESMRTWGRTTVENGGYWERIFNLNPQYEPSAYRCQLDHGLNEVDVMPTLVEKYSNLGTKKAV